MAKDEKRNNIQNIMNQKIPLEPTTCNINTSKPKTNHKQPKQTEHSYKTNSNQINQNIYTELPKHSYRTSTIHPNVYYSQKPCVNSWQTQPTKEPSLTKQEFKTSIIQMITTIKYLLFEIMKAEIEEQEEEEDEEEQEKEQKKDKKTRKRKKQIKT